MKKNKKDDLYESKWEIFLRNYHDVPSFKALVKLAGYFLFFLVFIIVVTSNRSTGTKENAETEKSEVTENVTRTYKDILNEFRSSKKKIEVNYKIDEVLTKITAEYENNTLSGIIENTQTIRFKIVESEVYQVLLETETLNPEILGTIKQEFLEPNKLIDILELNQATKRIEEAKLIYQYNIDYNNTNYNIIVNVVNESVNDIEITNELETYSIIYK